MMSQDDWCLLLIVLILNLIHIWLHDLNLKGRFGASISAVAYQWNPTKKPVMQISNGVFVVNQLFLTYSFFSYTCFYQPYVCSVKLLVFQLFPIISDFFQLHLLLPTICRLCQATCVQSHQKPPRSAVTIATYEVQVLLLIMATLIMK